MSPACGQHHPWAGVQNRMKSDWSTAFPSLLSDCGHTVIRRVSSATMVGCVPLNCEHKPFLPIGHSNEKSASTTPDSRTSHYSHFKVEKDESQTCSNPTAVMQSHDYLFRPRGPRKRFFFIKLSKSSRPNVKRFVRHCQRRERRKPNLEKNEKHTKKQAIQPPPQVFHTSNTLKTQNYIAIELHWTRRLRK